MKRAVKLFKKEKRAVPIFVILIIILLIVIIGLVLRIPAGRFAYKSPACSSFIRGDADNDGKVAYADSVFISNYLSDSGPAPACLDAADANDNGLVEIGDAGLVADYSKGTGQPPAQPFPGPGTDEACDGTDNDRDGLIDEGCSVCVDNDADSFCSTEDCNDLNPRIFPGQKETRNGKDDDCDGIVDE